MELLESKNNYCVLVTSEVIICSLLGAFVCLSSKNNKLLLLWSYFRWVVCKRLLKSTLAVSIFGYAQSAHFRTGEALLVATQYQLTHAEVDRLLRKNENSKSLQTFVQSYDYNHLPANSPCEDQRAEGYCRLDNSYFFGVFHGHAVLQCAKAVAGRLYDYLAVSILPENVLKEIYCGADFSLVDILETS
uniref:Uncharacterized protein n=1 Tax=Trichuris muris TaxID=70415 RepID=A0A5S6QBV5_TRIMR